MYSGWDRSTRCGPPRASCATRASRRSATSRRCSCRCRSCCRRSPRGRAHFGIPEGPAGAFLYVDVSSQMERKNPEKNRGDPRLPARPRSRCEAAVLVLKFTNAGQRSRGRAPAAREKRSVGAERGDARRLSAIEPNLCALINTADCYLSPHRSENGMTILEAIAPRKAGDRHELLRHHRLHDAGEQLPARLCARAARGHASTDPIRSGRRGPSRMSIGGRRFDSRGSWNTPLRLPRAGGRRSWTSSARSAIPAPPDGLVRARLEALRGCRRSFAVSGQGARARRRRRARPAP